MAYRNTHTFRIVLTALMTAIEFVITRFIQIPIPLGYLNVGNSIILFSCVLLPFPYGLFVGAVGAAAADLLSYPVYTLPTLVIKALMAAAFYALIKISGKGEKFIFQMIFAAAATLIPLIGYTIVGIWISGSFVTGIAQLPGLIVEYIVNLIILLMLFPICGSIKR